MQDFLFSISYLYYAGLFLFQFLSRNNTIQLIARTNTTGHLEGNMNSFLHNIYRLKVYTCLFQCDIHCSGSRTGNQQFVAHLNFGCLNQEFSNSQI